MRTILNILAALFTMNIMLPGVEADDLSFSQDKIPASQWEQYPQGIALALVLTRRIDAAHRINKHLIKVYIKNTSKNTKILSPHGVDYGIELYYIDSNDSKVPLHYYGQKHLFSMRLNDIDIQPGATLAVPVDISGKEASLLKKVPVECRIELSDPATNQSFTIESSAKLLTIVDAGK